MIPFICCPCGLPMQLGPTLACPAQNLINLYPIVDTALQKGFGAGFVGDKCLRFLEVAKFMGKALGFIKGA